MKEFYGMIYDLLKEGMSAQFRQHLSLRDNVFTYHVPEEISFDEAREEIRAKTEVLFATIKERRSQCAGWKPTAQFYDRQVMSLFAFD